MRPRKKDRHLPKCLYFKHGKFYFVKGGKWDPLGADLAVAMVEYTRRISPPKGGMDGLIERVYQHVSASLAPNTLKQYRLAADRLKDVLAEFSPEQVRQSDVAAIKTCYANTPNMANRMLSFLRVVFQYAVEWQEVENNPCIGIKRCPEKKRGRYISDDEYTAVRAVACPTLVAVMDILYLTGQRIGDVLTIRLSDITDDGIAFKQQKTNKRLVVRMTSDLRAAIDRAKALPRSVRGMTLFCSRRGTPYAYRTIKDMLMRATKQAGVDDFHLHDLRAKALTDAKNEGKDPQKLGGHATPAMTARYIRQHEIDVAEPPSIRRLIDVLDKMKVK